jgi:hypothetical protein
MAQVPSYTQYGDSPPELAMAARNRATLCRINRPTLSHLRHCAAQADGQISPHQPLEAPIPPDSGGELSTSQQLNHQAKSRFLPHRRPRGRMHFRNQWQMGKRDTR